MKTSLHKKLQFIQKLVYLYTTNTKLWYKYGALSTRCIRCLRENIVFIFAGVAVRFPARLFVEGLHRLVPLYAPDDGDRRELRCFRSRRGRAALYVEAAPEEGPERRVATFKYEVRSLERRHYDPATADCRPCSEAELELAFCTSDLGETPHKLLQ